MKIVAVNPGSTSTKVAFFEDEKEFFSKTVEHNGEKLAALGDIPNQLDYRKETVEAALKENDVDLGSVDIFVGRGGGLVPLKGGTYIVDELLLNDARRAASGAHHPAELASQICALFADEYGAKAYIVNPPDVDEYQELARWTGLPGMYRQSHIHALNQKEIALRYCKENALDYSKVNLIIAHIGGGISVTAHQNGQMVDSNDIIGGEGPMMPTRTGSLPAASLAKLAFSGKYDAKQLGGLINKTGGLMAHLGTVDAKEVESRIESGDAHAKLIYDVMIYQIAKEIGSCAAVLSGDINAIILTGGIAHSKYVVSAIESYVHKFAPVAVMPGEFEMEALAAGALRVARSEESALSYTGIPVWIPPSQP